MKGNRGESLGVSPSCRNSRQPDGMGWEGKGRDSATGSEWISSRLRLGLGCFQCLHLLTRSSPVTDASKWCQSSGLFINWGWMGGSQWEHRKSVLKIAEAVLVPPVDTFLACSTQICAIRLPHANLLRFHTLLNIYYHCNKLVDFKKKKKLWLLCKCINKVISFWNFDFDLR